MSVLNKISCDVNGCENECEDVKGDGWVGWGMLKGKEDSNTGSEDFCLCPSHLNLVFDYTLRLTVKEEGA